MNVERVLVSGKALVVVFLLHHILGELQERFVHVGVAFGACLNVPQGWIVFKQRVYGSSGLHNLLRSRVAEIALVSDEQQLGLDRYEDFINHGHLKGLFTSGRA